MDLAEYAACVKQIPFGKRLKNHSGGKSLDALKPIRAMPSQMDGVRPELGI